ncbi:DUF4416 family protein [bacterium]|nr:DUF4416 family protein [bacterium]
MQPEEPQSVKLLCGVLYSDPETLEHAFRRLESVYGPVDYRSTEFPFDLTDYYVSEMGSPIMRLFLSFQKLMHPKSIARIKIETNAIESDIMVNGRRRVNLDPGYMDYDKVVLASAKYNGQKIYLDHGIWADLTLHYTKGHFDPYPWSFPDFKLGLYNEVFLEIRRLYKEQRKQGH